MLNPGGRTPLVGRQRELGLLGQRLEEAARAAGSVVLVRGEPGVGKTRLLSEFAAEAKAAGWQVLAGSAYDGEGMPPYLPFTEALREYVRGIPLEALRAHLNESGPEVGLVAPDIERRLPDLAGSQSGGPEERRYRLFESVRDFLLGSPGRSGASGLVLILDDLHWADNRTSSIWITPSTPMPTAESSSPTASSRC